MATNDTNATRPKSKAQKSATLKPPQSVLIRITPECAADLERLRSMRSLNNRIATKPTILAEAVAEALKLESELMRANVNQIMKRVGGANQKITS